MGARTCLLCGKPLSRIWAGTGEDFCSREHRNQYRLRRGMDRLLEASKVASVMRRRENPRQIPTASLRSTGPSSQRGFNNPQPPRDLQLAGFAPPKLRPALRNRLDASSRFRAPRANPGQERPAEITRSKPLRFPPQPALPPPVAIRMAAHVMQAPASDLPRAVSDTPSTAVAMPLPWHGASRPPGSNMPVRHPQSPATALACAPPARRLVTPCIGRAFRVSMASGFRLPDSKLQAIALPGPEIAGMIWPGILPMSTSAAAGDVALTVSEVTIAERPMSIPLPPPANFERRFEWPGAIGISIHFVNAANGQRTAFVPFGNPDEFSKERR
jgi:hypothetical protein